MKNMIPWALVALMSVAGAALYLRNPAPAAEPVPTLTDEERGIYPNTIARKSLALVDVELVEQSIRAVEGGYSADFIRRLSTEYAQGTKWEVLYSGTRVRVVRRDDSVDCVQVLSPDISGRWWVDAAAIE